MTVWGLAINITSRLFLQDLGIYDHHRCRRHLPDRSGVDRLPLAGNQFPLYVGAQAGDDVIAFTGEINSTTVQLGAGDDTFDAVDFEGGLLVGGLGDDEITITDNASDSSVKGGDGEDEIDLLVATAENLSLTPTPAKTISQ